jgi:hypothetical protein
MLGFAAICWTIWKTRNKIFFEKKHIKNLAEILYSTCASMRYLICFCQEETQKMIRDGVHLMINMTIKLPGKEEPMDLLQQLWTKMMMVLRLRTPRRRISSS